MEFVYFALPVVVPALAYVATRTHLASAPKLSPAASRVGQTPGARAMPEDAMAGTAAHRRWSPDPERNVFALVNASGRIVGEAGTLIVARAGRSRAGHTVRTSRPRKDSAAADRRGVEEIREGTGVRRLIPETASPPD